MSELWLYFGLVLLAACGCLDGYFAKLGVPRTWAAGGMLLLAVLAAVLPQVPWGSGLTVAGLAACVVWLGATGRKNRLRLMAGFGLAVCVVVALRLIVPLESGQLGFSLNWLFAPVISALVLACCANQQTALFAGVAAIAGQGVIYALACRVLGHPEAIYLDGVGQLLACHLVVVYALDYAHRFYRYFAHARPKIAKA